jgi:hypothetical protein
VHFCNYCCSGKEVLHIVVVYVALITQHAIRIFSASYYTAICGLSDSTLLLHVIYLYTPRFSGKNYRTETCVLIFSPTSVRNISSSKNNLRDIVKNAHKVPVILVGFSSKLNFSNKFSKKTYILNFMKIRPVGTEWLHSNRKKDGRMDMTKLTIFFLILRTDVKKEQIHFLKPT